jgi:hypothetical protein
MPLSVGRDFDYLFSMPNRREMKPDRRSEAQARRKLRSILVRDAYFAIFVATLVVGGAKLLPASDRNRTTTRFSRLAGHWNNDRLFRLSRRTDLLFC